MDNVQWTKYKKCNAHWIKKGTIIEWYQNSCIKCKNSWLIMSHLRNDNEQLWKHYATNIEQENNTYNEYSYQF